MRTGFSLGRVSHMPAEAPFLFLPYSSNKIIEFSHFQEMVLPWDFFVSNGASKRTGLDLYAYNVNNKYGCFHCRVHSYVTIIRNIQITAQPHLNKALLSERQDSSYILCLTHRLSSLHLLRYRLHHQLFGSLTVVNTWLLCSLSTFPQNKILCYSTITYLMHYVPFLGGQLITKLLHVINQR
jgi:hypothetical protein